jgi:hypothetical protein
MLAKLRKTAIVVMIDDYLIHGSIETLNQHIEQLSYVYGNNARILFADTCVRKMMSISEWMNNPTIDSITGLSMLDGVLAQISVDSELSTTNNLIIISTITNTIWTPSDKTRTWLSGRNLILLDDRVKAYPMVSEYFKSQTSERFKILTNFQFVMYLTELEIWWSERYPSRRT